MNGFWWPWTLWVVTGVLGFGIGAIIGYVLMGWCALSKGDDYHGE